MPTPSISDLPKPKDWNEFEDIVWEVYKRRWRDPHAQRYGRSGQAQRGVDIYGQQNGSSIYIAIQCKRYEDSKLDLSTITLEAEKAEKFSSSVSEYIIATTASRDARIQDFVRQLNTQRISENKFSIHVVFWEDLCSFLVEPDNYDLIKKYYSAWEEFFGNRQNTKNSFHNELENIESQVPQSILAAPYWRVIFAPQTYNTRLLTSRNDCTRLIEENTIQIQGWSYPRKSGNSIKGSNWIGSQTDLIRHEYWRLCQSGQFINFAGTWSEDTNNIITDGEVIYTATAAFKFATNLCQQEIYTEGITIMIELNNIKGFGFKIESDLNDFPSQYRKATDNSYRADWVVQSNSLGSTFDQQGLEAIIYFSECFCSESFLPIEGFRKKQQELLGVTF
jgi:Restriction endonuclease